MTHVGIMTWLTGSIDELIPLVYALLGLALLLLFRHELRAPRVSSVLVLLGAVFGAAMLVADVAPVRLVALAEAPAQIAAVVLLLLAHLARYREVIAAAREVPATGAAPTVPSWEPLKR